MLDNQEPIFIYLPKTRTWQTIYVPLTKQRQQELVEANKKQANYQPRKDKYPAKTKKFSNYHQKSWTKTRKLKARTKF